MDDGSVAMTGPSINLPMRVGHANSAITLSIDGHALPADVNAAAEVWNTAMSNIIQAERKPAPVRMLAIVSRKAG